MKRVELTDARLRRLGNCRMLVVGPDCEQEYLVSGYEVKTTGELVLLQRVAETVERPSIVFAKGAWIALLMQEVRVP